jgi:LPXTG-motif cell wall-anchored protein
VPAPQPEPAPPTPKELPRTASPMELVGLVGLLSMSGFATGYFRRRK